ncbi:MAG: hypothetical protein AAGK04_01155 [Planctomycetota bacterium]
MPSGATLILLDGDLPGLIALATAAERLASDATSVTAGLLNAMFDVTAAGDPARVRAAKAQASRWGVEMARAPIDSMQGHESRSARLLLTLEAAREMNCRTVLWPIWSGRLSPPDQRDIDAISTELDRVELLTRLVGLDAGPTLEAPYADLDHDQLADLAVDLDVPASETWWGRHADEAPAGSEASDAERLRRRWLEALQAAGWRGSPEMTRA